MAANAAPKPRTAIVTGSSRGIGLSIATRLASDGYSLCINDVSANSAGIDAAVKHIESLGQKAIGVVADVTQISEVESMIEKTVEALGPLNLMVANAGITQVKPLLEVTQEDWTRMFDVNARGVFNCYQAAAKAMVKQGNGGKLVGAASIVAYKPFEMLGPYSASKWAVRGLTQVCAMEWGQYNITVNGYAPGIVGTNMWEEIDQQLAEKHGKARGSVIKDYVERLTPLKRASVPDDVAKLVSFFGSPDSDFVTGQTYIVDGGICMS